MIHFASSKSCTLLYWQRYCTALEQWARAKLCGVKHTAPPIFSRATITLGIDLHSSYIAELRDGHGLSEIMGRVSS